MSNNGQVAKKLVKKSEDRKVDRDDGNLGQEGEAENLITNKSHGKDQDSILEAGSRKEKDTSVDRRKMAMGEVEEEEEEEEDKRKDEDGKTDYESDADDRNVAGFMTIDKTDKSSQEDEYYDWSVDYGEADEEELEKEKEKEALIEDVLADVAAGDFDVNKIYRIAMMNEEEEQGEREEEEEEKEGEEEGEEKEEEDKRKDEDGKTDYESDADDRNVVGFMKKDKSNREDDEYYDWSVDYGESENINEDGIRDMSHILLPGEADDFYDDEKNWDLNDEEEDKRKDENGKTDYESDAEDRNVVGFMKNVKKNKSSQEDDEYYDWIVDYGERENINEGSSRDISHILLPGEANDFYDDERNWDPNDVNSDSVNDNDEKRDVNDQPSVDWMETENGKPDDYYDWNLDYDVYGSYGEKESEDKNEFDEIVTKTLTPKKPSKSPTPSPSAKRVTLMKKMSSVTNIATETTAASGSSSVITTKGVNELKNDNTTSAPTTTTYEAATRSSLTTSPSNAAYEDEGVKNFTVIGANATTATPVAENVKTVFLATLIPMAIINATRLTTETFDVTNKDGKKRNLAITTAIPVTESMTTEPLAKLVPTLVPGGIINETSTAIEISKLAMSTKVATTTDKPNNKKKEVTTNSEQGKFPITTSKPLSHGKNYTTFPAAAKDGRFSSVNFSKNNINEQSTQADIDSEGARKSPTAATTVIPSVTDVAQVKVKALKVVKKATSIATNLATGTAAAPGPSDVTTRKEVDKSKEAITTSVPATAHEAAPRSPLTTSPQNATNEDKRVKNLSIRVTNPTPTIPLAENITTGILSTLKPTGIINATGSTGETLNAINEKEEIRNVTITTAIPVAENIITEPLATLVPRQMINTTSATIETSKIAMSTRVTKTSGIAVDQSKEVTKNSGLGISPSTTDTPLLREEIYTILPAATKEDERFSYVNVSKYDIKEQSTQANNNAEGVGNSPTVAATVFPSVTDVPQLNVKDVNDTKTMATNLITETTAASGPNLTKKVNEPEKEITSAPTISYDAATRYSVTVSPPNATNEDEKVKNFTIRGANPTTAIPVTVSMTTEPLTALVSGRIINATSTTSEISKSAISTEATTTTGKANDRKSKVATKPKPGISPLTTSAPLSGGEIYATLSAAKKEGERFSNVKVSIDNIKDQSTPAKTVADGAKNSATVATTDISSVKNVAQLKVKEVKGTEKATSMVTYPLTGTTAASGPLDVIATITVNESREEITTSARTTAYEAATRVSFSTSPHNEEEGVKNFTLGGTNPTTAIPVAENFTTETAAFFIPMGIINATASTMETFNTTNKDERIRNFRITTAIPATDIVTNEPLATLMPRRKMNASSTMEISKLVISSGVTTTTGKTNDGTEEVSTNSKPGISPTTSTPLLREEIYMTLPAATKEDEIFSNANVSINDIKEQSIQANINDEGAKKSPTLAATVSPSVTVEVPTVAATVSPSVTDEAQLKVKKSKVTEKATSMTKNPVMKTTTASEPSDVISTRKVVESKKEISASAPTTALDAATSLSLTASPLNVTTQYEGVKNSTMRGTNLTTAIPVAKNLTTGTVATGLITETFNATNEDEEVSNSTITTATPVAKNLTSGILVTLIPMGIFQATGVTTEANNAKNDDADKRDFTIRAAISVAENMTSEALAELLPRGTINETSTTSETSNNAEVAKKVPIVAATVIPSVTDKAQLKVKDIEVPEKATSMATNPVIETTAASDKTITGTAATLTPMGVINKTDSTTETSNATVDDEEVRSFTITTAITDAENMTAETMATLLPREIINATGPTTETSNINTSSTVVPKFTTEMTNKFTAGAVLNKDSQFTTLAATEAMNQLHGPSSSSLELEGMNLTMQRLTVERSGQKEKTASKYIRNLQTKAGKSGRQKQQAKAAGTYEPISYFLF